MTTSPSVSVVMPLYEGVHYLREAIQSILNQTYSDFEFIIVDDGSTDGGPEIVSSYHDARIRLIRQEHGGISVALNRGISESRSPYIARMDSDDISHPERLRLQFRYLEEHPDVALVGTWYARFGVDEPDVICHPVSDFQIKFVLYGFTTFGHGSVMIRKSVLAQSEGYRFPFAEDYDLWLRVSERAATHNIPRVLYRYRLSAQQLYVVERPNYDQYERQARFCAYQRLLFGRDRYGHELPQLDSTAPIFRCYQGAALWALHTRNLNLALRLFFASWRRDWRMTIVAWLTAVWPITRRLITGTWAGTT